MLNSHLGKIVICTIFRVGLWHFLVFAKIFFKYRFSGQRIGSCPSLNKGHPMFDARYPFGRGPQSMEFWVLSKSALW